MPRWDSMSSVSTDSTHTSSKNSNKSLQQSLVTTCVGSTDQLRQLVNKITALQLHRQVISWSSTAINTLFYFMRCSQVSRPTFSLSYFLSFFLFTILSLSLSLSSLFSTAFYFLIIYYTTKLVFFLKRISILD